MARASGRVNGPRSCCTSGIRNLTREDLGRVFEETESIYSEIERLFGGTIGKIRFLGGDDYKYLLKHVRLAVGMPKPPRTD
jgi:hypothetical protein